MLAFSSKSARWLGCLGVHAVLLMVGIRLLIYCRRRRALRQLIPLLTHPSVQIRRLIVRAIRVGSFREMLPLLKQLYRQAPRSLRIEILKTLRDLGSTADEAFLRQQMQSADRRINLYALRALVRIDFRSARTEAA